MSTRRNPYQTTFTRTGKLDMLNRKPFRTGSQQAEARRTARRDADGTWRSSAPVSYHSKARQQVAA